MAIKSFRDERLARLFRQEEPGRGFPPDLRRVTGRKLEALNAADSLAMLRTPPANRLELLVGDRAGQHSIRVNAQFRICFRWTPDGPADLEFVDYH